jgi:N-acetylglucosaminyldiphosphoundecaprenol N-acetyl-beta-D-mannosaminyltransferase
MRNTVNILNVLIDRITIKEAVSLILKFLNEESVHTIYTPNSEMIMEAQRDISLKAILNRGNLVIPDGAGVVLASRILGVPLPEKVPGFDLVNECFRLSFHRPLRFFFFGGKPGVAQEAAAAVKKLHSKVEISGLKHGYIPEGENDNLIEQINSSRTDILLVALGCPKQEKWIDMYAQKLDVKICIGVGGTLDVLAGRSRIAPDYFRRNGLEWLYRLYQEPSRFVRMLNLPRFILQVLIRRVRN